MTVLFVIATIILFLSADWILHRVRGRSLAPERPAAKSHPIRLPEGIFFSPSHTWLSLFPSGKIRLGIDDFISSLVDMPDIKLLKNPGESIRRGDPLILLQEGGHTLTIRSPLSGKILAINEDLPGNPALLKERLFIDGWSYVIKPEKLNEIKRMLIGAESQAWIRNEFRRLRDLFAGLSKNGSLQPAFLQDGGPPVAGVLRTMDDAVWKQLDREFLEVQ